MKKKNIFQNRSQQLLRLFEKAGNRLKMMCVPIDYAKKDHIVMFCNGHGDIVRKPFSVKNSLEGVKYLIDQVMRSCRQRHIKKEHVFFGGEDTNSYAENFANALRAKDWLVANVNAHDAKKQRDNLQASTDRIDLMGIATMLLNFRAKCSPAQEGIYRNLRTLVRHRKKLVVMKTEVKNRVHTLVDRLFPGFLNEKNTGINAFSKSSLFLMEDRFSAQQIRRRQKSTLIKIVKRCATPDAQSVAAKLHSYAAQVITTPDEYAATLQLSLQHHIKHYRCLQENIDQLLSEIGLVLAQTQGAFLTSIKGVGIVLAAGVSSEIGNPFEQKPLNNLTSYCGIIPRVNQSGGIEGHTHTGRVSKRSNHILKDYVVQSALQMGLRGPEPLLQDYKRREATGQHAGFGIGRRFLRMAMCLMRSSQVYLPPTLRSPQTQMQERAGYYLTTWPLLRDKWKKAHAHQAAFAKDQPLGQWRQVVQELYDIKLKL